MASGLEFTLHETPAGNSLASRLEHAGAITRREFVASSLATAAVLSAAPAMALDKNDSGMLYRTLGSTGEKVSAIGLGGFHNGNPLLESESIKIIRTAIDRGITFMDNCWDYHDGKSEKCMGKALRDGYRAKVFLMTKLDGRSRQGFNMQLDESLERLQTDHVDLIQFHEIIRMTDPDKIFAPGGALEAALAAKKAGKVRYIGFTGHKDPMIHLHILELAKKNNFHFDTVQMPLNVMDAHYRSFEHLVLPELLQQKIGVLGMKSIGSGEILKSKTVTPIECLHYALNLPTSVVINGIDTMKLLNQAFEATSTFSPLSAPEVATLLNRTSEAAQTGQFEPFKTSEKYDSTAKKPEYLI